MLVRPSIFAFAFLSALVALTPRSASADVISSCGNISVSSTAMCHLETSGGCTAQCTPVSFEASCAANLETTCTGQCTASADVMCMGSCNVTACEASCMANPGTFTCQGQCEADCDGNCQGSCMSNGNQSQCQASCKASCGAHCNTSCTGTPPMATCMAQCQASCTGSCAGQANLTCDETCQSTGYASCESMLMGGCQTQCMTLKGALFCDGQFIDASNVDQCMSDLKALLNITVTASSSGSCSGNMCSGQAQAAASCDVSQPGEPPISGGLFAAAFGVFAGIWVRRLRGSRPRDASGDPRRDGRH
jgi:hypothetical protein